MQGKLKIVTLAAMAAAGMFGVAEVRAESCTMTGYKNVPGLMAAAAGDGLTVTWEGDKGSEVRMKLGIVGGTPTIQELAVKDKGGSWATLGTNITPEYRVVSGIRRTSQQQLNSLRQIGEEITPAVVEREVWDPFWDAPLEVPGENERNVDMPRHKEDIKRATSSFHSQGCTVVTNGTRLEVEYSGLEMGIFSGRLQLAVYKGSNLIRMEAIAKTEEKHVAYKYDAGFKGLPISAASRVDYHDLAGNWEELGLAGNSSNKNEVTLRTANRLVVAEEAGGSIAAFPPPHIFFWPRETDNNLGYSWYRKDSDTTFSIGVRQAEHEDQKQYLGNFALYNAPPGTWQRMSMFFLVTPEKGKATMDSALAFTHGDRYKALPGYQTMAHHYHTMIAQRSMQAKDPDLRLPDLDVMRATGMTIASPADFHGDCYPWDPGPRRFACQAAYYDGVKKWSDSNFLIMPDEEVDCNQGEEAPGLPKRVYENPCPAGAYLGGHWDVFYSHPVFWTRVRAAGQPFMEMDPKYGKVYHVGSPEDIMKLMKAENMLIFEPHPRTKESTGYPDAVKDKDFFADRSYRGIGWRWGMGLDLSETRMSDKRASGLIDDMNNWIADKPVPAKFALAISETRYKQPGMEDLYGMEPINYIKVATLPTPNDMSPIINALDRGDFFVSTGEVLIPTYAVEGSGSKRTITADAEWTFPLEYAEVIWGDGQKTDRQIIPLTDLPAFGKKHFSIPFDTTGKKWVRFAIWDSAGNGAFVQPVKLK